MEYSLRKVNATDIFTVTTIISKIGIREFKSCLKGEDTMNLISDLFNQDENEAKPNNDAALSAVGLSVVIDIVGVVLANVEKCKDDIFTLLSSLSGIAKKDVATLDGEVFMDMLLTAIQDNSKVFIGVASKLLNLAK